MESSGRRRRPSAAIRVSVVALMAALGGSAAATSWRHLDVWTEPFTKVGESGAPPFSDGGQGDCLWGEAGEGSVQISGLNPPAFYRDPLGRVSLAGVAVQSNGGGGGGMCGGDDSLEDAVVFVLPPGYRPENVEIVGGGQLEALVAPDEGAVIAVGSAGVAVLDGFSFRAAGRGTQPIESDPVVVPSLRALRQAIR